MLSQKFYFWLRIIDRKLDWPQLNISFAFSSFSVCFKSLLSTEYCSAELFKNKVHTGFAHVIINYSKELTEAQLKLRLMFWLSYTVRYFNLWFATLFNKVKTQSLLQWHFKFWSITTISYLTMESYEMHHLAKTISLQLDLIVNRWGWTISNGQCLFKWIKVKTFAHFQSWVNGLQNSVVIF